MSGEYQYNIAVERSGSLYRVTVPTLNLETYVTRLGREQSAAADRIASHIGVTKDQVEIVSTEYIDMAASDVLRVTPDALPEGVTVEFPADSAFDEAEDARMDGEARALDPRRV